MADQTILALSRSATFRPGETVETQHATDGTGQLDLAEINNRFGSQAPRAGIITNGTSAVGTLPDNALFQTDAWKTGDLTIGYYYQPKDATPSAQAAIIGKTAANLGLQLAIRTTGAPRLRLGNGSALVDYDIASPIPVPDGTWYFGVARLDRDGLWSQFVNGAVLGSVSIAAQAAQSLASTGALQCLDSTATTAGTWGDFWIVAGLLSDSRIADINKAGSIAPFCIFTPDATTGRKVATIDGLSIFTWPDFVRADPSNNPIAWDRSGSNQHFILGISGLTAAVPLLWRNTVPATAHVSDGSNGAFIRNTLNAQNPGPGDAVLLWEGIFPQDAVVSGKVLAALSPSAGDINQARTLWLGYSASGTFVVIKGATTNDYLTRISLSLHSQLVALGAMGIWCAILVLRANGGVKIMLGIGCDAARFGDVTNLFTESPSGSSPPAWTDQIDGQYFVAVYRDATNSSAHTLHMLALLNFAPTEAELRRAYALGWNVPNWAGASKVPKYLSDFSVGTDGWTPSSSVITGNQDAVSDGSTSKDDCLLVYAFSDTTTSHICYRSIGLVLREGDTIRFTCEYYIPAGQTNVTKTVLGNGSGMTITVVAGTVLGSTVGQWALLDATVRIVTPGNSLFTLRLRNNADTPYAGANSPTDDRCFYKNIRFEKLGVTASLSTNLSAVPTLINESAENGSGHFLTSLTGVRMSPDGRRQIIPAGTLTFTAGQTLQLFGAGVINTGKKQRIVSITGTASAGTNLSVGNASNGAQYVSAQAVTGDFDIGTFVTRRPSGANLWLTSSAACTITDAAVILEQVN